MNHAEAVSMVRGKTNKNKRKIGNNTHGYIEYDGSVSIELHNTKVVVFYPNGLVKLSTGGWTTSTTKDRINKYSPVKVHQRKFDWYITLNGKEFPFIEGMLVQA
jgi:hypothetical protein